MCNQNIFRIIHLSDLHLTASDEYARSEPKLFGKLIGMNQAFRTIIQSEYVQQANLIVITGDVTDSGLMAEWHNFWQSVRTAGIEKRLLIVPGNHDVCCLGLRDIDESAIETDLLRAVAGLQLGQQPTRFPWCHNPNPNIIIFGLNSNNLGNSSGLTNAMGELGYYQLKAFASLLHKYREVPIKIVALHHSPNIPEKETSIRRGVEPMGSFQRLAHQLPEHQRHALMLLCIAHRIRLVIHGHVHREEDRRISGIRIVGAPATTEPQNKSAVTNHYRIWQYTLRRDSQKMFCKICSIAVQN